MQQNRMTQIFKRIEKVKIAVCGDFCLDIYWELDPAGSEISAETGLPGQAVKLQRYEPGGAGNVVANIAKLKPKKITAIGVVGKDLFGRKLFEDLTALNIDTINLFFQPANFDTYAYCKRYLNGKELERIDFGFFNERSREIDELILKKMPEIIAEHDAFIFNQQIPNAITDDFFIDEMNDIFQDFKNKIIIVDSRHYGHRFKNVIFKMNERELARMTKFQLPAGRRLEISEIEKLTKNLFARNEKPIFVTRGERGIAVFDGNQFTEIPGIRSFGENDPVGAGDTAVSMLACSLAAGATPAEAAELANFAAAVVVKKIRQAGTATFEEIFSLVDEARFLFQPELAENLRLARYLPGSKIEICCDEEILAAAKIRHVVFDHDGTISTLRRGWEEVMEKVMIDSIFGDKMTDTDRETRQRIGNYVVEYIEQSSGIQTILQMEALVEMVRSFGFVPPDEIKTPLEYKEIYNKELLKIVNQRLRRLESGELSPLDFTIEGAISFLKKLRELGVTLYLASGTDRDDTISEARALGYAEFFNGGIYGSVNDVKKYSKKLIIQNILRENDLHGNELAVFGDGPVEISECRRAQGVAVGVASDEIKRHGLNAQKRKRLINAGAHLIISDFMELEKLMALLW